MLHFQVEIIGWSQHYTDCACAGWLAQFLATWQLQVYADLHYLHVTFNHLSAFGLAGLLYAIRGN